MPRYKAVFERKVTTTDRYEEFFDAENDDDAAAKADARAGEMDRECPDGIEIDASECPNCESWEPVEVAPGVDAVSVAAAAGFVAYHTGGGCMTWSKELPDRSMLWVCDDGNGIDSDPDDKCWMIGRHDGGEGGSAEINELFDLKTAIEHVAKIGPLADPTDNVYLDTLAELDAGVAWRSR